MQPSLRRLNPSIRARVVHVGTETASAKVETARLPSDSPMNLTSPTPIRSTFDVIAKGSCRGRTRLQRRTFVDLRLIGVSPSAAATAISDHTSRPWKSFKTSARLQIRKEATSLPRTPIPSTANTSPTSTGGKAAHLFSGILDIRTPQGRSRCALILSDTLTLTF